MAAANYIVHRHQSPKFKKDRLTVWKPVLKNDLPVLQIDQGNGVTASIEYRPEEAEALAQAILTAAGRGHAEI